MSAAYLADLAPEQRRAVEHGIGSQMATAWIIHEH